jgi:hypothetical protein
MRPADRSGGAAGAAHIQHRRDVAQVPRPLANRALPLLPLGRMAWLPRPFLARSAVS